MTVALILLCAIVGVGLALYIHHRLTAPEPGREEDAAPATDDGAGEECCGMHITCERDSLLASVSENIEYYDDEELDRFRGRGADAYSDVEEDEFRDILLTLRPDDIPGWARSIQLRGIELPAAIREELLMIVAEARAMKSVS